MTTQVKINKMKLIMLSSLDTCKMNQIFKNIDYIVKAWKLESVTTLNELCSVCKKYSSFTNLDNGVVQYVSDFNDVTYVVDIQAGFTMDEIRDLSNMASVHSETIL